MKINKISPRENVYLQILENIANAPKSLNYIGILPNERKPTVAIVGTRKPTVYGKEVTHRIAHELAQKGVVIISGLAFGVDYIAQASAVRAGGTTIAVLANALPDIRPASNRALADAIIASGSAIVSEKEEDYVVGKWSFLERNRIVSGLADAVIITEAASRSGSLNTAAHALEQGKDVFVVPGNITSTMSAGCNQLLKQGAQVLTSSDDVITAIAPQLLSGQSVLPLGTTPLETKIIALLAKGIRDGDELQQKAETSATELSTTLTMLEINGAIRALGANQWTLR